MKEKEMIGYILNIADWKVDLQFTHEDDLTGLHLVQERVMPFLQNTVSTKLFTLTVDCTLEQACDSKTIQVMEGPDSIITIRVMKNRGYEFVVCDKSGTLCTLLQSNPDSRNFVCSLYGNKRLRAYGLNHAMMVAFAMAGAKNGTLMVHSSVVRNQGRGYAFIAKSGTGKSTQSQNWIKVVPGTDLMNDDNPIIRVLDGVAYIYGSPWSGKTPCYRQVKAPLAAVVKISRSMDNTMEPLSPIIAFTNLLSSVSVMKFDTELYQGTCQTVSAVVQHVKNFTLHCTAQPESAQVCHDTLNAD